MEVQRERSQPNAMVRIYDAALNGDVHSLNNLLQEDALILERCIIERGPYTQSPLHVAAKMGHLDFVIAILVKNPSTCFAHDEYGMTPIHVAVIHGQIDVLETFHGKNPQAIRERTKGGETVLHLCVKHNRMDAFKFLLDLKDEVHLELLNSKDSEGNTILHLAVIGKQVEMIIELLVEHKKRIAINEVNSKGLTAMDCHLLRRQMVKLCWCREITKKWPNDDKIGPYLEKAKALRAKDAEKINLKVKRVKDQSNALMVAASVIAAMAFQIILSPPGGFWQEDGPEPSPTSRKPGTYIQEGLMGWHLLVEWNTVALASSLSVILLLIGGLPYGLLFVAVLRIAMWIAVTATAITYAISIVLSETGNYESEMAPFYLVLGSIFLMLILILVHTHNFLLKLVINHLISRSLIRNYLCCAACTCAGHAADNININVSNTPSVIVSG